jgi:hypothetical protein
MKSLLSLLLTMLLFGQGIPLSYAVGTEENTTNLSAKNNEVDVGYDYGTKWNQISGAGYWNQLYGIMDELEPFSKLSFTQEYSDRYNVDYFVLRTHMRFANSFWTWCIPLSTLTGIPSPNPASFLALAVAVAGNDAWKSFKDLEQKFVEGMNGVQLKVQADTSRMETLMAAAEAKGAELSADLEAANIQKLRDEFQAKTYERQIEMIKVQEELVEREVTNVTKKIQSYRDWVGSMSVIFNYEILDCTAIDEHNSAQSRSDTGMWNLDNYVTTQKWAEVAQMSDKHRNGLKDLWNAKKLLTFDDDDFPTDPEFGFYRWMIAPFHGSIWRATFMWDDLNEQLDRRAKHLKNHLLLLHARRKFFSLLIDMMTRIEDDPDNSTDPAGSTNGGFGGPTPYPAPSVSRYDAPEYKPTKAPDSWATNAQLPTMTIPAFSGVLNDLDKGQSQFNSKKSIAGIKQATIGTAARATKAMQDPKTKAEVEKHIKDQLAKNPKLASTMEKARAGLNSFLKANQGKINGMNFLGNKNLGDAKLAEMAKDKNKKGKYGRNGKKKSESMYDKKRGSGSKKSKLVFGSSSLGKKKGDEEAKQEIIKGSGLSQEQIDAAMLANKNQDGAGDEISGARGDSIFDQIHERYLKSIHRLFRAKKN